MEPCPTCSDAKLNSICLALKRIQIMMSEVIHELDRDVYGSDNVLDAFRDKKKKVIFRKLQEREVWTHSDLTRHTNMPGGYLKKIIHSLIASNIVESKLMKVNGSRRFSVCYKLKDN